MSLRVIAAGPLATIQDSGRFGYRAFGVPVSGPFDRRSAALANALAGNEVGAAVVELTGFGGVYLAEEDVAIAIAGAPMRASVERYDGSVRAFSVPFATGLGPGDRLNLGGSAIGLRCYLAACGGWLAPAVMGSRSSERPLVKGDLLHAMPSRFLNHRTEIGRLEPNPAPIRYADGPDVDEFVTGAFDLIEYRVGGESDRMGVRLDGPTLPIGMIADRLSIPVAPGAIQIAGGVPIVLGPACGTMGGYPNIGYVLSSDLDRIGQARPGQVIQFKRVTINHAREIDREYRRSVAALALRLLMAVAN